MMRSTLLWLMSRSCQRATFSSAATALPRSTRARPVRRSQVMGLRLCGMALLPFWPLVKGSSASSTSVRCRCRNSAAQRSMLAPTRASVVMNSAWMSRWMTCVAMGAGRRPSLLADIRLDLGREMRAGADRAGKLADGHRSRARVQAVRARGQIRRASAPSSARKWSARRECRGCGRSWA